VDDDQSAGGVVAEEEVVILRQRHGRLHLDRLGRSAGDDVSEDDAEVTRLATLRRHLRRAKEYLRARVVGNDAVQDLDPDRGFHRRPGENSRAVAADDRILDAGIPRELDAAAGVVPADASLDVHSIGGQIEAVLAVPGRQASGEGHVRDRALGDEAVRVAVAASPVVVVGAARVGDGDPPSGAEDAETVGGVAGDRAALDRHVAAGDPEPHHVAVQQAVAHGHMVRAAAQKHRLVIPSTRFEALEDEMPDAVADVERGEAGVGIGALENRAWSRTEDDGGARSAGDREDHRLPVQSRADEHGVPRTGDVRGVLDAPPRMKLRPARGVVALRMHVERRRVCGHVRPREHQSENQLPSEHHAA
jgi:hypothetical protein